MQRPDKPVTTIGGVPPMEPRELSAEEERLLNHPLFRHNPPTMPTVIDWNDPKSRLYAVIAAMWDEYNADDEGDQVRINHLIEEAAELVAQEIGGYDQLDKLAEGMKS